MAWLRSTSVALMLGALAQSGATQVAGEHPNRNLLRRGTREVEVRFADAATPSAFTIPGVVTASIGSEDGEEATVFGDMVDVAVIDDSTIAILDATVGQVRLFSRTGRHRQTFGRVGAGPGEFRGLAAVQRAPNGELLVTDARRVMQVFGQSPRGYEYRRSVTLPVGVRSLCFLGDRLFVNGASSEDGKAIRELDESGAVMRAFGVIYESDNALLNWQVAQGRIVCDAERQLIYHQAGAMFGDVRAYRPSGEEVWRVWVSDYATNRVLEQPRGGVLVQRSPVGAHTAGALTLTPRGQLLAQWLFITRQQMDAKEPGTQVYSFLIDPSSGRAQHVGASLPLIKDLTGGVALSYRSDPFPLLEVYTSGLSNRGAP